MNSKRAQIMADLALVFVTLVWGATFVTVQEAIQWIEPYYFLAIRFSLAFLLMLVAANKRMYKLNMRSAWQSVIVGLMLFSGYAFQTFGLKYTTASNTGFITGLSVVIVPVLIAIRSRKLPALKSCLGIISATVGMGLLTINSSLHLNPGDLLVFMCAVSYALHIILLGKYSPENDSFVLSTMQIGTVAVASFIFALFKETPPPAVNFNKEVWIALIITSVLATALAFFVQTWTQKYTSPTHTAIIFTMEPVFAAVFAYFLGGEAFTLQTIAGAFLILIGMLGSEFSSDPEEVVDQLSEDPLKV